MASGHTEPVPAAIAESPFAEELQAAIDKLYDLIDTPRIDRWLEVCFCNCCMVEETRQAIIATPVRDLPPPLMQEFTNSAHGYGGDDDNLRAFLPRYLDLIARDVSVSYNDVGADLLRFGHSLWANEVFLTPEQTQVYHQCAALMIRHFGWREGADYEDVNAPYGLVETFLSGGVHADVVTTALEHTFSDPKTGARALAWFAGASVRRLDPTKGEAPLSYWAIGYAPLEVRGTFAAWLSGPVFGVCLETAFLSDNLDEQALMKLDVLMRLAPEINLASFPDHRRHATA